VSDEPDDDSTRTPLEGALGRVSTAHLSFAATTREIVDRLETRRTKASLALVDEGKRLVDSFEAWARDGVPPVSERNARYVEALAFHDAARVVLGDRRSPRT